MTIYLAVSKMSQIMLYPFVCLLLISLLIRTSMSGNTYCTTQSKNYHEILNKEYFTVTLNGALFSLVSIFYPIDRRAMLKHIRIFEDMGFSPKYWL